MNLDCIILVADSREHAITALRTLGIPSATFLRPQDRVHIVTSAADAQRHRGVECAWAGVPGREITAGIRTVLTAQTRHPEMDFYELIARRLAWRIWHDY